MQCAYPVASGPYANHWRFWSNGARAFDLVKRRTESSLLVLAVRLARAEPIPAIRGPGLALAGRGLPSGRPHVGMARHVARDGVDGWGRGCLVVTIRWTLSQMGDHDGTDRLPA